MEQAEKPGPSLCLSPMARAIARELQGDIPLSRHPFAEIAARVGQGESEVLTVAEGLRASGVIRKFGAVLRHQRVGYKHNWMVLWAVPAVACEAAGRTLAGFPEVTHCYERHPPFLGRYRLFTMVHFRREDRARLEKLAAAVGCEDFRILQSLEEFKKTSMGYF